MKKKNLLLTILFFLLIALTCCQGMTEIIDDDNILSEKQTCQSASSDNAIFETTGITWSGITVGQSTREDVLSQFGEPDVILNKISETYLQGICWLIYREGPNFWISNDKVVGINLANFGFRTAPGIEIPHDVQELSSLYGQPDFVGWHGPYHNPGERRAVWASAGIMAEISIDTERVSSIVYFPPMDQTDYLTSSLSQFINLSEARPNPSSDYIEEGPRDPFNWGD